MDSIRLINLRSLEDTGYIDLKPITVLVGQNSSGKSTFLRTFPLLRQSVEEKTTGPILWYGRYVDFGGFSESINSRSTSKEIAFGFKFKVPLDLRRFTYEIKRREERYFEETDLEAIIYIQSAKDQGREVEYVSKIELFVNDKDHYVLIFGSGGKVRQIKLNGNDIINDPGFLNIHIYSSENTLVPMVRFEGKFLSKESNRENLYELVYSKLKSAEGNILIRFLNEIEHMGYGRYIIYDEDLETNEPINVFNLLEKINMSPDKIELFKQYTKLSFLSYLLSEVQSYIFSFANICTYIAPVRATAERFYRPQNLSVEDVDFQGKNLAVFLRSMNANDLKEFNRWTERHFNFSAHITASGGQLSVIIDEGGVERNLADTGFGYSQVLPVITQLWSFVKSQSRWRSDLNIFAIEQPELHLHPKMQAKLADALIDALKIGKKGENLRLIIETHSEKIVNRLGHRIAKGDISPEMINVVIFEKATPDQSTTVNIGKFDRDGFLTNWPYGFFEPNCEA